MAPDIAKGLRAATATLVPFYLATELGRSELGWMAIGGWLGTLTDPGGTRSTRARALAAFAVAGSFALVAAEAASRSLALATAALAFTTFAASLARPLGATVSTVGTMIAI